MLFFWVATLIFMVLLAVLFRTERLMLKEGGARRRALIIDAVRLTVVAALFLLLPYAEPRPEATVGLALAAFCFIAVPSTWMLAIGGVDPRFELKQIQEDAAALMAHYPSPMPNEGAEVMERLIQYLGRLRNRDTAELVDLLVSRYRDWIVGAHRPIELGRRSIRIYELQREIYGDGVRSMQLTEEEATFRWRLYRLFNSMTDCGSNVPPNAEQRARFKSLVEQLDEFRREDTTSFIDDIQASARAWLALRRPKEPWQPGLKVESGTGSLDFRKHLWPSTSVFWGAILDEEDRRELHAIRETVAARTTD